MSRALAPACVEGDVLSPTAQQLKQQGERGERAVLFCCRDQWDPALCSISAFETGRTLHTGYAAIIYKVGGVYAWLRGIRLGFQLGPRLLLGRTLGAL